MAMRKSFGNQSFSKAKAVDFGGGSNSLQNMILAQALLPQKLGTQNQADIEKEKTLQQSAVPQAKQVVEQFGGQAPVGWKYDQGGVSGELTRKYSPDEATTLSSTDNLSRHVNYIKESMDSDPKFKENFSLATMRADPLGEKGQIFGIPTTIGNTGAMKLAFHLNELNTRLNYLLSGKQINDKEFARLSRTLPSWIDVSDDDPNYELLKMKLDSFTKDMNNIKGRLVQGGTYDVNYWDGPIQQNQQNKSPIPGMNNSTNNQNNTGLDEDSIFNEWKRMNP